MADYKYITETGAIVPDTSVLLEEVQNEYKEALGADLDVSPSTPQGRLIAAEVKARAAMVRNNAVLASLINPDLAFGVFLDALCALTGVSRRAATHSRVTAIITGTPGTAIPAGSRAKTEEGDIFYLENAATIETSGTVNAYFIAQESGPIACPAGALTQIVDPVLGWDNINNSTPAELGEDAESDASLKLRRKAELYQGSALVSSITSALLEVQNVNSVFVYENYTDETQSKDGVAVAPHSIYTVVDGGENYAVAQALFNKKSAGCNYTGTLTVEVTDTTSGVSYPVKFSRPEDVNIFVSVSVKLPAGYTGAEQDVISAVKNAVLAYAAGDIAGVDKPAIGVEISAFEIASAITAAVPDIFIKSVQIGTSAGGLSYSNIPIMINQIGRFNLANITVEAV